jgi:flagellar motor switch/type III secretory pathway protein FliN
MSAVPQNATATGLEESKGQVHELAEIRRNPLDLLPWLPCELTLQVPLLRFTVDDLLTLAPGIVVETACHHTADLPLRVNGKVIGWAELEVIRDRIAVRITELA